MSTAITKFAAKDTFKLIQHEIKNADEVILAVSYWGSNGAQKIGLDKSKKKKSEITIVCDLMSGACNPNEIETLLCEGYNIWTLDRLHAKVYWTPNAVMIGSSNASTNGQGGGGADQISNFEANVLISDSKLISCVRQWLDDEILSAKDLCKVTKILIEEAKEIWRRRNTSRPVYTSKLSDLLIKPDVLRSKDWWVYAYSDIEFSDKGSIIAEGVVKEHGIKFSGWEFQKSVAWPGRVALDYFFIKGKFEYNGVYMHFPTESDPIRTQGGYYFHIAQEMNTLEGIKVDQKAKQIILEFMTSKWKKKGDIDEAVRIYKVADWWVKKSK